MDAEIRDAWRSENYGRWRLLRDRASSDLLPVLRSEYPKWLFFERIVGFAPDESGELLLKLLAKYPNMHRWQRRMQVLLEPIEANLHRRRVNSMLGMDFRPFEEAIRNVYVKSAQMGFTAAMLQPLSLHDELQVYPATAREYAARDAERTRSLGPRKQPNVETQSPVMRKRKEKRR